MRLLVPETLNSYSVQEFELEMHADRTWQPRPSPGETRDDRELSVAVCNVEVISGQ
jgi:hypothetical protein